MFACFALKYSTFFLSHLQILAVQNKKKVEYFKVKWVNICDKGCTWEPVTNLVGDEAKKALHVFKEKAAAEAAAQDEARRARAAGTGEARVTGPPVDVGEANDDLDNDGEPARKKARRRTSSIWKWYSPKYYEVDLKGHYAKCKLCRKAIKVVNTSNLIAHISQKHPEVMVDENEKSFKV